MSIREYSAVETYDDYPAVVTIVTRYAEHIGDEKEFIQPPLPTDGS